MILLVTATDDPIADHVARGLARRGARHLRFDPGRFPSEASVHLAHAPGGARRVVLAQDGATIDLREITTAWEHRPRQPEADPRVVDPAIREHVRDESARFLDDLWQGLDCRWVPAPRHVVQRAQHKGSQLGWAEACGFTVPATLIGNDPDAFLDFYQRHGGRVIAKVFERGRVIRDQELYACFTEQVAPRDLVDLRSVRLAPMIVQAYVPKRLEVRVTVVGERIFAAAIDTQATHRTRHDARHADLGHTPHRAHALPADVAASCLRLVRWLGLAWATIDLVITPDDQHVFLELNPSGQWLWIERLTDLPITDALCDLLAAREDA
jgi:glutathione synthase/RimK-type ligase-like ATP-grasp enzyme